MYHSHASRLFVSCLLTGLPVVFSFAPSGPAQAPKKTPSELSLYHADPEHLWNRLHSAIFVRVGPDGRAYGQDRLEPLLWLGSKHLLEGPSHKQAVAVLEEFVKNNGEKLVTDPLKRAMLQRDLWLLFNWVEIDHSHFGGPPPKVGQAAQARLRGPLATAINRLALGPKEIQQLLDNYAAAVTSGAFAKQFDPKAPDKPYLPADLFAADGPWVCVGRPDGPVAPVHLRDWDGPNVFTNSAFLLFLRLPGGRAATLAYLKKLRSFDEPLMVKAKDNGTEYVPNPKLPQFPVGTEAALVRRAMLVDSKHRPVVTALTESVQVRVYRKVPQLPVTAYDLDLGGGRKKHTGADSWQSFHEFRLSRGLLFAGKAGGLSAVGWDERDFETGFASHPYDVFEFKGYRPANKSFAEAEQEPIRGSCFSCHGLPGVSSFNSFFDFRHNLHDEAHHPYTLLEMPVADVAGAAVKWKEGRPSWAALQKVLAK
jgi:hypothetical protein